MRAATLSAFTLAAFTLAAFTLAAFTLAVGATGCARALPPASPAIPLSLKPPFTGFTSAHYGDPSAWLCLPGRGDACSENLDATELRPDGTRVTVHDEASPGRDKVDCFYVYPTVDLSLGPANHEDFKDLAPMTRATVAQAARFRNVCRLFVPLYRQATIGVYLRSNETRDEYLAVGASDILDAFVHYMANFNEGRKIVLIGHSQGAEMVARVLSRFFDSDAEMRGRLLLALAIGGSFDVPANAATGGTFMTIPECTKPAQTSCVVAYRSYLAGIEPSSYTAAPGPGHASMCVNPAQLDKDDAARGRGPHPFSRSLFPVTDASTRRLRGIEGVTTPWVELRDFYQGECVTGKDGFRYLAVSTVPGDPRTSPVDLSSRWLRGKLGLHILDFQFAQGDLVDLVAHRAAALP